MRDVGLHGERGVGAGFTWAKRKLREHPNSNAPLKVTKAGCTLFDIFVAVLVVAIWARVRSRLILCLSIKSDARNHASQAVG